MPVVATHLQTVFDNTDATSYVTASQTPTAFRLVRGIIGSAAATTPNTPTLAGNGITWASVVTVTFGGVVRLTYFRGLVAAPTAGTVTIDFGGQTQSHCLYSFAEFAGVDTSGTDGSGAVVQSASNSTGGATSLTVTLAAFATAANATDGGFFWDSGGVGTVGSGFTILGQASGERSGGSEWRNDNDTTVDMSWAGAIAALGVAVELRASSPDGGWSLYRPYTLGATVAAGLGSGLFYYWRRRKQERPDE